jgi:hypothetical protein
MTTWKPAELKPEPTVAPSQADGVTVTDSGLRALNAADGLFLRAEHLRQMQAYAREFARLAGVAAGPGVDYGYTVALDGRELSVSPGLAVDGSRLPLRSNSNVPLKLDTLPPLSDTEFWVVEVTAVDPVAAGSEAVYGTVCSDPCGGSSIQPWLDAAVQIRLTRDSLDGLQKVPPSLKRNRLASLYFERERSTNDPWLTPTGENGPIGGPLQKLWSAGAPDSASPPGPVRLAVVFQIGSDWVVDTWIARRDIGDGPARAVWENRLGLRPWNVFIAQVLQFQAQMADTRSGLTVAGASCEEQRRALIEQFENLVTKPKRHGRLADDVERLVNLARSRIDEEIRDVTSVAGYEELPPAGILPSPGQTQTPKVYFESLFGPTVDLEVAYVQADCALKALADAEHLDRIPVQSGSNPRPYVRLLVPVKMQTDLKYLKPQDEYPWMVFVRACGPPKVDEVPVFVVDVGEHDPPPRGKGEFVEWVKENARQWKEQDRVALLTYPVDAWAKPQIDIGFAELAKRVPAKEHLRIFGTIAPGSTGRVALMSVRTGLLAVDLLPTEALSEVHLPAIDGTVLEEAIFILHWPIG